MKIYRTFGNHLDSIVAASGRVLAFVGIVALAMIIVAVVHVSSPMAGYDCYDGKSDDCTLQWSLAHRPKGDHTKPHLDNSFDTDPVTMTCVAKGFEESGKDYVVRFNKDTRELTLTRGDVTP